MSSIPVNSNQTDTKMPQIAPSKPGVFSLNTLIISSLFDLAKTRRNFVVTIVRFGSFSATQVKRH